MNKKRIRIFINYFDECDPKTSLGYPYQKKPLYYSLNDSLKWVYNNEPKGEYYIKFF